MKQDRRKNIRALLSYVLIIALFIGAVPFPVAASGTTSANTPLKEGQEVSPVIPNEPDQTVSQPELPPVDTHPQPEDATEKVPEPDKEQQTIPQELSFLNDEGNVIETIELQEGEFFKIKVEGGSPDILETLTANPGNAIAISERDRDGYYTLTAVKAQNTPVTITAAKTAAEGFFAGEKKLTISVTKKQPAEQEKPQKEQQPEQPSKNQENSQNAIQQLVPSPNPDVAPTPEEQETVIDNLPEEQETENTPHASDLQEDKAGLKLDAHFNGMYLEDINGDTLKKELRVGLNTQQLNLDDLVISQEASVTFSVPESESDIAVVDSGNNLRLSKNGVVTVYADFQKEGCESTQDQIQVYILIEPELQIQVPDKEPTYDPNGLPVTVTLKGFRDMQSGVSDTVGSIEIYEIKDGGKISRASADISKKDISKEKIEIPKVKLHAGVQQLGVRFSPNKEWEKVYREVDLADTQQKQALAAYSVKKAAPKLEVKGITDNKIVVHENEIFHINVSSTGEGYPVFEEVSKEENAGKKLSSENGGFRAEKTGTTYIQLRFAETENYLEKEPVEIQVDIVQRTPVISLQVSENSAQKDSVKLKAILHDLVSINALSNSGEQDYGKIKFSYKEADTKKKTATEIAAVKLMRSSEGELFAECTTDVFKNGTEYLVEAEYVGSDTTFYQNAVPASLIFTKGKENPEITLKDREGNLVADSIHLSYTQEQTLTVEKINVSQNSVSGNSVSDNRTIVYSLPKADLPVLTLSDNEGNPPKLNTANTDYELEVKAGETIHIKANQSGKSVPLCVKSKADDIYNEAVKTVIVAIEQSETEGNYQIEGVSEEGWYNKSPVIKAKETSPYNMLRYAKSYVYDKDISDLKDKYTVTGWSDWVPDYTVADGIYAEGSAILIQMAKVENDTVQAVTNDFAVISLNVDTEKPAFHLEYFTKQGEPITPTKELIFNTDELQVRAVKDEEGNTSDINNWEFTNSAGSVSNNVLTLSAPCKAEVKVKATDAAGNSKEMDEPLQIIVDNSAPEVTVSANTVSGNCVSENIVILGTYGGKWTNKNVLITLSENSSVTSGIDHYEYSTKPEKKRTENDWGKVDSKNKVCIDMDTNAVYAFRAVSNAGVKGKPVDVPVRVQKTAPGSATITINGSPDNGREWYQKAPTVSINAPDYKTGIVVQVCYELTIDSDNNKRTTNQVVSSNSVDIKPDMESIVIDEEEMKNDGVYTLHVWTQDEAGNETCDNEGNTSVFKIDGTEPTDITIGYSDNWFKKIINQGTFGYFYQDYITVTVSANGNISGIESFEISKDSGQTWGEKVEITSDISPASTEFSISPSQEEEGKVRIRVTDRAGNVSVAPSDQEFEKSPEYVFDQELPDVQVEATYEGEASNGSGYNQEWTNRNLVLTLSDFNNVKSGIDYYQYDFVSTEEEVKSSGNVQREWKNLKDLEVAHGTVIQPDDQNKDHKVIHRNQDHEEQHKVDSIVSINASVNGLLGDNNKYYVANQILISANTSGTYYFRAVSNTGNASSEAAQKVYVQKDIPDNAKVNISENSTVYGWYNNKNDEYFLRTEIDYPDYKKYQAPITVNYILRCDRNNNGEWDKEDINPEKPEKFTISTNLKSNGEIIKDKIKQLDTSEDGAYSLEIWTIDAAGNESESHIEHEFKIDTSEPTNLQVTYSENWFKKVINKITKLFYKENITVTVSADGDISGIEKFQISKDNGKTWSKEDEVVINSSNSKSPASAKFSITPSHKGTVQVRATDRAGNVSETPSAPEFDDDSKYVTNTKPPTVQVSANTLNKESSEVTAYDSKWTNQDVILTLLEKESEEVISGIDYYQYQYIPTSKMFEQGGPSEDNWKKLIQLDEELGTVVQPDKQAEKDKVEHENQNYEVQYDLSTVSANEVALKNTKDGLYYVANQIRISKDTNGTFYFRAVSNSGVKSNTISQEVYVQKTAPNNALVTLNKKPITTDENIPWFNEKTKAPEIAITWPEYQPDLNSYQAPLKIHYEFTYDKDNDGVGANDLHVIETLEKGRSKNNNWVEYTPKDKNVDTSKDGIYTLEIYTEDEAGNRNDESQNVKIKLKVDTTPPENLNVTYTDDPSRLFKIIMKNISFGLFYNDTMTLTATSNVSISGLQCYQVSRDGGKTWGEDNRVDGKYEFKAKTRNTVLVRVVDNAGNITTDTKNPEIVVDSTTPVTTIVPRVLKSSEADNSGGTKYNKEWTNQDVTLKLSDSNKVIAGIDYYEYQYIPTSEKSKQGALLEDNWKKLIELDQSLGTVVQPDKQASNERVIHENQKYELQGSDTIFAADKALLGHEKGEECYFVANQIRISKDTNGIYYFRAVSNTGITGTVASQEVYIQKTIPNNASVSVDREQDAATGWFNHATQAPRVTINCPGYQSELKSYQAPMTVHYIFTYDRDNNGLDSSDINPDMQEKTLVKGRNKKDWTESVPLPEVMDTSGDGVYTLKVWTTDEAGNRSKSSEDYERTFRVDTTNPIPAVSVSDNKWKEFFNTITFGLFFSNSTEVAAMSAEDTRGIFDISGRAKLEYQKVKNQADYDTDGEWTAFGAGDSFDVSPNEKFIAYVKATDNAGNVTIINTDGVIVDDKAPTGEDYGEITITPEQANANGFYNKEVSVGISVIDPDYWQQNLDGESGIHSGLKEVSYRIMNSGSTTTDWTPLLVYDNTQPSYEELQQAYKGTITVPASGNDSNEITVEVYAMDNAGNEIGTSKVIQIDTTQPVIDVSYNVNTPENQTFYKTDRVATVHIRELNFNPDYVEYNITRNGESANGIAPTAGAWRSDGIDHYADIVFHEDGDYRVTLECTDQADNRSNYAVVDEFTIDETLPVIEVTYNNHNARENNYYKEDRTATIQITEHNFDSSKVQVTGTATENGAGVSFPSVGGWSSSGDVHTASISYTNDAHYTFDISYIDMAGNEAADYTEEKFVVDKTKPTLSIKGTKHESANNADTIGFTIIAEDNNFGTMAPKINAIVRNADGSFVTEEVTTGEESVNGNTHTRIVENLDKDGIYSISCAVEDKAGNICDKVSLCDADGNVYDEKEFTGTLDDVLMEFSVNREGSTYRLDLRPEDLNGKITNEEAENIQVTIEEINVDQLEDTKSRMDLYNGLEAKNIPLREGENYQVNYVQGEGGWRKYTYSLNGDNFKTDGNYKVSVYTVDKAGNQADSSLKNQSQAKLEFIIDRTKPEMTINLENKATYNQIQRTVELNFTELHLDKDSIQIVVNKEPLKMDEDVRTLEDGSYEFELYSGINQVVDVTYQDLAGNANATTVERVTVSTSWFVRAQAFILNNLVLCIVVVAVILAAAAGLIIAVIWKKRRNRIRIDGE